MGKSVESVIRLKELSRVVSSSAKSNRPKTTQPISPNRVTTPRTAKQDRTVKVEPPKKIEALESRTPLARVVAYCSKRWFQDTLKGAKAGDSSMQVLVGQMYNSGYGVPRDPQKVFFLFNFLFIYVCFSILFSKTIIVLTVEMMN